MTITAPLRTARSCHRSRCRKIFCGRCGSTLAASLQGEVRGVLLGGIGGDAPQYDTWPDAPGSLTR